MTCLALGAHPDDIEFMMSGTLFLLKRTGWELHYMNLANGCCGTESLPPEEIVAVRAREAVAAASVLGAVHHPSLCNDIEVFYEDSLIRRTVAVIREVQPDLLLLPALDDYMEDHMNTARIGATAAFCRGMRNYRSIPDREPYAKDVAVFHALPYGLRDRLGRLQHPEMFVDVSDVMEDKRTMLACHKSQKDWLDVSQGIDAYLEAMDSMAEEVGRMAGDFAYAEGFRTRNHLGFSAVARNPIGDSLDDCLVRYDL